MTATIALPRTDWLSRLRSIMVLRPGQRVVNVPGAGVSVSRRAVNAAGDWWAVAGKTCVAAYAPKGAASYAASLTNLANPGTYDATEGTAPSWATGTGWTFNGSSQWLKTGLNSTAIQTILFRHASWVNGYTGSHLWRLSPSTGGAQDWRFGNEIRFNDFPADGVMGQAGLQPYKDGAAEGTAFSAATPNRNHMLGAWAWEYNSIDGGYAAGTIVAWAAWAEVLTAGEIATVSAAMAAL